MGEDGPHAEYARRLAAARSEAERLARRGAQVSNLRLLVFATGVVLAWLVFGSRSLDAAWLAPAIALFLVLVVVHDRILRRAERDERVAAFYERGLARLGGTWAGGGEAGERFRDPAHPYAEDLDLFGTGSLFELLCTARTHAGEEALARCLCEAAAPDTVRARQAAVSELRPRLDLREDLARLGEVVRTRLDAEVLRRWGEAPVRLGGRGLRAVALLLPALTLAALYGWLFAGVDRLGVSVALAVQLGFAARLRGRVREVVRGVELPARELALLAELLERVEAERFQAPALASLRTALETEGVPPSRRTTGLRMRLDLLDARRNQLFAPIGALLLWTTNWAFSLEAWRAACGPALGRWLEALGEIEALASLAGYAYEHPDAPFPELAAEGPCFEARELGHPLLPAERCIRNDLRLGPVPQVLVVSGSNMSGKSTLLRTVGVNAALAFAGAPVCARSLRLSPLAVGASIRLQDSLQEGSSRFYAEIRRLRQIVALAEGERPVLFLLDEILAGTNSHDRGIGAEAVLRGLVERGGIGLVTTHDLALTAVADRLGERGANVHFVDHLEGDAIVFDYRLRPGVVEKSNALALMRAVGLDV